MAVPIGIGDRFFQGKSNREDQFLALLTQEIGIKNKISSGLNQFQQRSGERPDQRFIG